MELTPEQYVESIFPSVELLEKVLHGIREHGMPEISIASGYGRLLTIMVRMNRTKRILEIGALGGYSGICLASGLDEDGKLVSLELKQEFAEVALKHMKMAGLAEKVEYRIGEALHHLEQLTAAKQKFDFFFIDADKGNYPHYLEYCIQLANPGAIIVGDNVLMKGKISQTDKNSNSVLAMRKFNHMIATDPRLESTILPAYDGLAIARVK